MADSDRRTTTRTTDGAPASHTTVETVRGGGIPSAVWLVVGAVLAVVVVLYFFNGGLTLGGAGDTTNVTVGGNGSEPAGDVNAAVEGAADAVAAPDGTDAEVAPADASEAGN